jgi:hypothetical protein
VTFSEPNSQIRPTGEEAGEFLEQPQLSQGAGDSVDDGYSMLEREHREVEQEFTKLERDDDSVVREVCELLTQHIRREEAVLVPALRRLDGGDQLADRILGENSAVATMIAELYDSATPERVPELVATLRDAVTAHLDTVESLIVPALRTGGIDAQELADDLRAVTAP